MKSHIKSNKEASVYIFMSSMLFIYLLIRACCVPFAHDEASTFFRFVQVHSLLPELSREALNNHFLNTVLTYVSYLLFGSSKFALRLPNVLIALVYFVFIFKIARFLVNRVYRWGFVAVMLFAHFFVEFFAVSRGYGISMAFFMAAFYYLMKAIKTNNLKNHVYVSLSVMLMVAANINLVIPSVAMVMFQLLHVSFRRKQIPPGQKWTVPLFLFIGSITISAAFLYLVKLKEFDAFYLVAENLGFVGSTVKTLMIMLTGSYNIISFAIVLAMFVSVVIVAIRQLLILKIDFFISMNSAFLFVLLASVSGIFMVVWLFGVNFPEDRVAMYLFPLFVGSLFFVFDSVKSRKSRFLYLILVPLLFFPVHFVSSINVSYINGYKNEALPDRFYGIVSSEHGKSHTIPTIGGSNMRQFAWTYINYSNGGNENMIDWVGYPDTVSIFQILETKNYPYSLDAYDSIDHAPCSGLTLYKRKKNVPKRKVKKATVNELQNIVGNEYFNLLEIAVDTMAKRNLYFDISLSAVTQKAPITAWLVLQVVNKENSTLTYKFLPLNWIKHGTDGMMCNYHQSVFFGLLPDGANRIKIYIWNKDKMTYTLNSAKVEMFGID